ncbi:cytochrome P450 [Actinomadura barringtoniae]|uniref:Cytochrome P450 n=1 Tax=Actinomadura barringtoniae TaxID=1427535 RepID=A0A939PKH9_9ACTN|nr:cytochrome P450 [Actinomadura barringtoniae]MBO2451529.1 cytochrome P450 [Actinomadura barringtoniae]
MDHTTGAATTATAAETATPGSAAPDASAILGFDPFDPAFRADPYTHYRRLAAGGPLQRTEVGLWVTTSYEVCESVLRDPRFGHRPENGGIWRESPMRRRSFLTMDPPDHTRLRKLVSKAFTARLIERLRPRIEVLVDELLNGVEGDVDLLATLAYPLPVILISELLGVPPEDRDRFKAWSDTLARGLDPDFMLAASELDRRAEAREEFAAYFRELAERRRAEPREDLLSALVAVSDEGDVLSEEDLIATCVLLLVAGHETTVNLIGNGALALLRHPDQLEWFRAHPERVGIAVEELLRYDPPVQLTLRAALEDVELNGTLIKQGQPLLLLTGAANRDPAVFADPDRLDLARYGRDDASRHLAFGLGIHFCLGAPLARLEGQIALGKLFQHDVGDLREVALKTGELAYRDNLVLRGLDELPVHITRA